MENTRLIMDDKGHGGLFFMEKDETLGEMELKISGQVLTVFHTEVKPQAEGRGIAKKTAGSPGRPCQKKFPLCSPLVSFCARPVQTSSGRVCGCLEKNRSKN